jgi:LPXTG-site transpeptidase (sortase) family protein
VRPRTATGPGTPDRILIPALEVDAPVVPIQSKDRVLDPPADADVIGWWSEGARPGAKRGSALVTGHTIHTGAGALKDLETLEDGDAISVHTDKGDIDYVVEDVRVLTKEELAAQAETLFDQTSEPRLVVITCEDWDGSAWQSNVVVTALPR